MKILSCRGRVYREDSASVDSGPAYDFQPGSYSYHAATLGWRPVRNQQYRAWLSLGVDPGVMEQITRYACGEARSAWAQAMSFASSWVPTSLDGSTPNAPVNGPAALLVVHEVLERLHREFPGDREVENALQALVRLVAPGDTREVAWARVAVYSNVDETWLARLCNDAAQDQLEAVIYGPKGGEL